MNTSLTIITKSYNFIKEIFYNQLIRKITYRPTLIYDFQPPYYNTLGRDVNIDNELNKIYKII